MIALVMVEDSEKPLINQASQSFNLTVNYPKPSPPPYLYLIALLCIIVIINQSCVHLLAACIITALIDRPPFEPSEAFPWNPCDEQHN